MKKYSLFILSLLLFTHSAVPVPKPKNKFLEVLGHFKILTGFALIPLGALAAAYADADHSLYYRLEPSQRKDLSIFAPLNPVVLFYSSALCGMLLIAMGAQDVQESKEILE